MNEFPNNFNNLRTNTVQMLKNLIAFMILCFLLFGCGKKPDHEGFYYISGFSEDEIDVYVNENPTDRGNALSLFVIQGENVIEHRGNFKDDGFSVLVSKTKDIFSMNAKTIVNVDRGIDEANEDPYVSFYEPIWWRWNWQDADLLTGELTEEDRSEIFGILDDVCQKVEKSGFDPVTLIESPNVTWWSDDPKLIENTLKFSDQVKEKIPAREKLIFKRAPKDNIEFLVGYQIVMIRDFDREKLFYLGVDESLQDGEESDGLKWTFYYGLDVMFFCRFNGEWSLLIEIY